MHDKSLSRFGSEAKVKMINSRPLVVYQIISPVIEVASDK